MKTKTRDLTKGNITSQLIAMAIPLIATSFIQTTYSLIDMVWIGRLGSNAVVAVGTASFIINMAIALSTIVVTGTAIKIAHKFGAKEYDEIKEYIVNAFIVILFLAFLYASLVIHFKHEIIGFFNINDQWISLHSKKYLVISMLGIPIMYMNQLYTSTLNSFANSKLSFKLNSVGLLVNVILDPLLIFGVGGYLKFGVEGAAYASVIGRSIVLLLYIMHSRGVVDIHEIKFKLNKNKLKEVFKLGLPNMIQRVSFIAIGIIMARLIADFGATGIAVQKIGVQVESISYMTIGGLNGAVSVFIGQNFGVKNMKRIASGYKKALLISLAFGLFTTTILTVFSKDIFALFVSDSLTIDMGAKYLKIIGLSQMFMCIEIVSMAAFNGIGKTHVPAIVSLTFTSLRIPFAYILSRNLMMGVDGVWWSISATSMIKGIILVTLFSTFLYRQLSKLEGVVSNA